MRNHLKMLSAAVAVALAEAAAYAYTPVRHDGTYTTNGVTYAQRGGLGSADYVVTNVDASAVGRVRSVNGMVGDVVVGAESVGAVARDADYLAVSNAAMGAVQKEVDPSVPSWAKGDAPPLPPDYAAVASNAAVAVKTETDPTVPAWAKSATQPLPPDYTTVSNRAMNALQSYTETDPTVPAWAKAATKPTYGTNDIDGLPAALNGKLDKTGGTMTGSVQFNVGWTAMGDMSDTISVGEDAGDGYVRIGETKYRRTGIRTYNANLYFPSDSGTLALKSDIPSGQNITNAATWAAGNAYEDAVAAANAHTDASISETNDAFVAAVQAASPPVALPDYWALANVTNANGGAVSAADVGAAGAGEVVKLTGTQTISGEKTFANPAYFNFGLAAPSTIAVYGQDSSARFEVYNIMTGDYVHLGVDDFGGSIGFDYTKNGSSYRVDLPERSGVLSVDEGWASTYRALNEATTNAATCAQLCGAIEKATESKPHLAIIDGELHIITITD